MIWNYVDEWYMPTELPDLTAFKTIAVDTETFDPMLLEQGAGNVLGNGHLLGMSVAVSAGTSWYFPVKEHNQGQGFTQEQLSNWASTMFTRDVLVVGANIMYDIGWLATIGVKLGCHFYDVQFCEALINEHKRQYNLDSIALEYGLGGKVSSALYEWCASNYGGAADGRQRRNIFRAPLSLVGPYAEGDAFLPLQIRDKQLPILESEGLMRVVQLEHELIPVLMAMRERGVRIDSAKRDRVAAKLDVMMNRAEVELRNEAGREVNVNAAADIARVFDAKGWEYPLTEKTGKPSFTKAFLEEHESSFAHAVSSLRKVRKMQDTFVVGYFNKAHEGRLHPTLHPLRNDDYGTVSGRLSCSAPNVQNIPARDPYYGPLIRSLFIPEEGETWACQDFSQIEYRVLVHYATGAGAAAAKRAYREDASTDFHQLVMEATGMSRKDAKQLNFGLCYGQGIGLTARSMGVSKEDAMAFRDRYFAASPYIKTLFDACANRANNRGYLHTIFGRRSRFTQWEAADFSLSHELGKFDTQEECRSAVARALDMDHELANVRLTKRARTYKALNALLQGTAADIMKQSMVSIYQSGVCDILGAPLLTVHDELNWSVPATNEGREAIKETKHIMETAVTLTVPIAVDHEEGPNWGEVK